MSPEADRGPGPGLASSLRRTRPNRSASGKFLAVLHYVSVSLVPQFQKILLILLQRTAHTLRTTQHVERERIHFKNNREELGVFS